LEGLAVKTSGSQDILAFLMLSFRADAQKGEKQKAEPSSGKEIGKGGEDIGKGAGKGAESLGKGTAEGAGNLVTLHPGKAGADLGKGAGGAAKDVGVGTRKGAAKIGKGSAKGIGRLGKKIVGKGNKNKKEPDLAGLTTPKLLPAPSLVATIRPMRSKAIVLGSPHLKEAIWD
jgi:hypothetical protein